MRGSTKDARGRGVAAKRLPRIGDVELILKTQYCMGLLGGRWERGSQECSLGKEKDVSKAARVWKSMTCFGRLLEFPYGWKRLVG